MASWKIISGVLAAAAALAGVGAYSFSIGETKGLTGKAEAVADAKKQLNDEIATLRRQLQPSVEDLNRRADEAIEAQLTLAADMRKEIGDLERRLEEAESQVHSVDLKRLFLGGYHLGIAEIWAWEGGNSDPEACAKSKLPAARTNLEYAKDGLTDSDAIDMALIFRDIDDIRSGKVTDCGDVNTRLNTLRKKVSDLLEKRK